MHSLDRYFRSPLGNRDVTDEMRYEWLRIKSFSTFPLNSSQSSVRLARSGFYFTGKNQECVCFSCGLHHSNWTRENITELHKKLSPSCRHVHGKEDTNVPVGSSESNHTNHLYSESICSGVNNKHAAPHAQQISGKPLKQPSGGYSPYAQNNPSLSGLFQPCTPQPNHLKEALEPLGIVVDRPKYPSYSVLATRISSFQQWPSHLTQTPRDLSLAGFFYAGYGDYVRCFFCGGGLRNWEPGDDAWVEHARWFPKCPFLIQNRGQDFVNLIQRVQAEGLEDISSQEQKEAHADIEQLPAAQEILQMGYTWITIKETYRKLHKNVTDVTAAELIEEILVNSSSTSAYDPEMSYPNKEGSIPQPSAYSRNETSQTSNSPSTIGLSEEVGAMTLNEDTQTLIEENRRLKEQRLCRICMEEDVAIAFLPCGHLCCCTHCSPAMRKCPMCRAFIKGTVKTYPA
ncbi:baculoviral IAP repeat-containing protein 3-like [Saccostrea echinata]|uniref:baculoviral IAP repeat-containing protein 3-like n=1 Tax=Saccostrea echinata TaxID=191078 RepID=UPI002A7F7BF3|nr:baculoviral IAP repeat-containing protein 3-like [Saccostrea echinata]